MLQKHIDSKKKKQKDNPILLGTNVPKRCKLMSGTWREFAAAIGRCQSTPGLVESRGRVSLEDMWLAPLDYKTHAYSTAASLFSPSPSPTSRRTVQGLGDANVPRGAESPMSAASSGPSSEDQTARAPQSAATQPSTHSGESPFDLSPSLAAYVTLFPNTWLFSKMYPSCLSQKEFQRVWTWIFLICRISLRRHCTRFGGVCVSRTVT